MHNPSTKQVNVTQSKLHCGLRMRFLDRMETSKRLDWMHTGNIPLMSRMELVLCFGNSFLVPSLSTGPALPPLWPSL